MKAEKAYNKFLKTAKYLLKELDYYGENQFKQKITEDHWTIGQWYDYLINITPNYYISQVYDCLNHTNGKIGGGKNAKGKFIFWYKRFPAIFKYAEPCDYSPVQPESPVKMKDSFYKFLKVMSKAAQEIDAHEDLQSKTKSYKTLHPQLGMLSAIEWYMLIDMNFRNQLEKKYEIDRVIRGVDQE
jgi:hypothetical protein